MALFAFPTKNVRNLRVEVAIIKNTRLRATTLCKPFILTHGHDLTLLKKQQNLQNNPQLKETSAGCEVKTAISSKIIFEGRSPRD
jgi:hypothetical protein